MVMFMFLFLFLIGLDWFRGLNPGLFFSGPAVQWCRRVIVSVGLLRGCEL